MLDQAVMDDLGAYAADMHGERMEPLLYKTTAFTSISVTGRFGQFSVREQAADPILRKMRRVQILVADFPGEPAIKDVVQRANGSRYDVDAVDGGPGHAWWILTVRKVQ